MYCLLLEAYTQDVDRMDRRHRQRSERDSPETEYLVYCRSGRRSVRACTLMRNAGIKRLIHLDGGINAYTLD